MTDEVLGRRERKKAATRKTISDTATMLFLERGFDAVSIREIAEKADVSPTTVFAHFPQKEALVFDEDDTQRDLLVATVRDRPAGMSISRALHEYFLAEISHTDDHQEGSVRRFLAFIDETPSLNSYAEAMWRRHEEALADAIAADLGDATPSREVRIFARFVMQAQLLALADDDPGATVDAAFRVLESGWTPRR